MRLVLGSALLLATPMATGAMARDMGPRDVDALPASKPTALVSYGTDRLQTGELRLPAGKGPFPVAVVIHGGCWTKGFATARNTAPLASALTAKGIATWNIEYRQVGDAGGGWPGTFADWAAATDHLRTLAKRYPIDLTNVVVTGHSAGAHAALWVAARGKLPKGNALRGSNPLPVRAAVAIDGPGDLAPFVGPDAEICGKPVIVPLMGGTPAEVPGRYAQGSPAALLPLGMPQVMLPSSVLTPDAAEAYRKAAVAKGDRASVVPTAAGADHFNIIAPGEPQFEPTLRAILDALGRR